MKGIGISFLCVVLGFSMFGGGYISAAEEAPRRTTGAGMFARFCDVDTPEQGTSKYAKLAVSPGKVTTLCVDFLNKLEVPATMHVAFLDGYKEPGNEVLGCDNGSSAFGQHVTGYDTLIEIPPLSFKRVIVDIKMPVSAAGTVYGCVSVFNEDVWQEKLKQGGVATLLRNTVPIELFVDSKVEVGLTLAPVKEIIGKNLVDDPMFVSNTYGGKATIAVGYKNTGGLDESVEVKGTIKDILGKIIELAPETNIVGPDGYGDVRYEIPKLPWYQMWFDVDLTVTHHAMSEFRTEFITEKLLENKTLTLHERFFVFPWWIVPVILAILLIVWSIRKLMKKAAQKHQQQEEALKQLEELKKRKEEHGGQ